MDTLEGPEIERVAEKRHATWVHRFHQGRSVCLDSLPASTAPRDHRHRMHQTSKAWHPARPLRVRRPWRITSRVCRAPCLELPELNLVSAPRCGPTANCSTQAICPRQPLSTARLKPTFAPFSATLSMSLARVRTSKSSPSLDRIPHVVEGRQAETGRPTESGKTQFLTEVATDTVCIRCNSWLGAPRNLDIPIPGAIRRSSRSSKRPPLIANGRSRRFPSLGRTSGEKSARVRSCRRAPCPI